MFADALLVIPLYNIMRLATLIVVGIARGVLAAVILFITLSNSLSPRDVYLTLLLGVLALAIVEIVHYILLYARIKHAIRLDG